MGIIDSWNVIYTVMIIDLANEISFALRVHINL